MCFWLRALGCVCVCMLFAYARILEVCVRIQLGYACKPYVCALWAQRGGSTPRPSGLMQKRKMESQPRLGLGIINIAPFVEGLIYY